MRLCKPSRKKLSHYLGPLAFTHNMAYNCFVHAQLLREFIRCQSGASLMPSEVPGVYPLQAADLIRVLARLMLAWDGQWFLKVCDEFDWETAAGLNARVRAAFGRIEMRSMLQVLGKESADDLHDAVRILRTYIEQVFAAGFVGDFRVAGNRLDAYVTECAAWEGAQQAALERTDQACIACERVWVAWFKTLLPNRDISFDIQARMGYGAPRCHFVLQFESLFDR
jgi:hypothetical protein